MVRKKHASFYHGKAGKSRGFFSSLRHATRGLALAILLEANIRRQILIFLAVIVAALILNIELWQMILIVLAGLAVLAFELLNSAIESLADGLHPDYSEFIQRAKDMTAAAVLLVGLAAIVIGMVIFVPALAIYFSLLG